MEGTEEPGVGRLLVAFLRFYPRPPLTQAEFGKRSRVAQSDVSDYELGKRVPPEEVLRRMAAAVGVEWPLVVHLRRFFSEVLAAAARPAGSATDPDTALRNAAAEAFLFAVSPYLIEKGPALPERRSAEEAWREAQEVWATLEPLPMAERRRLLGFAFPTARSPALAAVICEASERAAAHDVTAALDLAGLALSIAQRVGDDGLRQRAEGYCRAHIANAHRVGNDFDEAQEVFTRALEQWKAGTDPEGLFPEWRVLDLEASLRRAQHRFAEALELLDAARALNAGDAIATTRVLLKKEHVLERMGAVDRALEVLAEAAPWVEKSGEHRYVFAHRFNTADNLTRLGRFAEAEPLLPEIRELMEHALDRTRVDWLEAKIAAGLGQPEEAIALLEQVQGDFTKRKLPYDAALAGLDLAELWLQAGRTAEVRELAIAMEWIFTAKGIAREALAALRLFCEAARREAATVELSRQVSADIEKARRTVPPPKAGPQSRR